MRIIHYGSRTLFGDTIPQEELSWKELPLTVKYDALHHSTYLFRINDKVYSWCSSGFAKAFEEARAWELLAR